MVHVFAQQASTLEASTTEERTQICYFKHQVMMEIFLKIEEMKKYNIKSDYQLPKWFLLYI